MGRSSFSGPIQVGAAYYDKNSSGDAGGNRGAPLTHIYVEEFGAIATLDADGICVDATATEAKTLSATGALVSGGVATLDVPRAVAITSTANNSGVTFSIVGLDKYGETMTESVTGPNNTTVSSKKAFKSVSSVSCSGAITANVDVGTNNTFGTSYRIPGLGKFLGLHIDGASTVTGVVPVAGLTATQTSTATTGDIRGTITSSTTAPNGSRLFTAVYVLEDGTKEELYGVAQA